MVYKSINDAAENPEIGKSTRDALRPGRTEIWYMNRKGWDAFHMGPMHAAREGVPRPMAGNVKASGTHELLGTIAEKDVNQIFYIMQGENWAPRGEANDLIRARGLRHTSMSVGDIIVVGGRGWMVAGAGFDDLPKNKKEQEEYLRRDANEMERLLSRVRVRKESAGLGDILGRLEEGSDDQWEVARRMIEDPDDLRRILESKWDRLLGPAFLKAQAQLAGYARLGLPNRAAPDIVSAVLGPALEKYAREVTTIAERVRKQFK